MEKTSDFLNDLIELMNKHNVTLVLDEVALLDFDNSESGRLIGILRQNLNFEWTNESA